MLLLLWLILQVCLYLYYGIRTSVDSTLYISNADLFTSGVLPEGKDVWYFGYTLFLAFTFLFSDELWLAVLLQVLASGVACWCIYLLLFEITKEKMTAALAVLFYLLWFKIHQWNFYIYTESLYTSLSIICITLIVKSKSITDYIVATTLFIFVFFIRPTGFNLTVGLVGYFIAVLSSKKVGKDVVVIIGVALVFITAFLLSTMLKDFTMISSYKKAEVIYPGISLGMTPPADLYLPPPTHSPLHAVLSFAWNNPFYFLKLSLFKIILFIANVKPYFSIWHNSLIVLILYPLYSFAVRGFMIFPKYRSEYVFIATYFIAQALTIGLSSENWDGRFLIPLLPFIFMLSAIGITPLVKKIISLDNVNPTAN